MASAKLLGTYRGHSLAYVEILNVAIDHACESAIYSVLNSLPEVSEAVKRVLSAKIVHFQILAE